MIHCRDGDNEGDREGIRNVFMDILGDKITEGRWRFLMVKNFSWYEILNSSKFLMMPKNGQ
jgi:hypothetical protein